MGTLHSNPETLALAARVRKAWATGKYSSYVALARKFGIDSGQARGIVVGRILKGGAACPDGNYRRYELHGKSFVIYDDGRVWSVTSNKFVGTYMNGYRVFKVVTEDGKYLNVRVSRVMLELFVRPPEEGEWARHLDDDPANNTLDNLAWGLPIDNAGDMVRNKTQAFGDRNGTTKFDNSVALAIVASYDGGAIKTAARRIVAEFGLNVEPLAVVRLLRGQTWTEVTRGRVPKQVVRAMHTNFQKTSNSLSTFSARFAAYLNSKGYPQILPFHVRNAIEGRLWKSVYDEFN